MGILKHLASGFIEDPYLKAYQCKQTFNEKLVLEAQNKTLVIDNNIIYYHIVPFLNI